MPTFAYHAIDATSGREKKGTLIGGSAQQVTAELKAQGLYPTRLEVEEKREQSPEAKNGAASRRRTGRSLGLPGMAPSSPTMRMQFTRQLATLVKAGMPLLRSMEVLERQQKPGPFRDALTAIAETIRTGGSLSDGLVAHPRHFDRLYLNMVKAGEAGGALDVVLERLAEFWEKAQKIRGKVKAAMTYPLISILIAVGVVAALIVFVVPRFESIFANLLKGKPLPALTHGVLAFSQLVQDNIGITVLGVGAVVGGGRWALRTKQGMRLGDRLALATPVLGDLVLKLAVARFTRTLGTLLSSGVQILDALQITRDTAGNVYVAEAVDAVQTRVRAGEGGGHIRWPKRAYFLIWSPVWSKLARKRES